MFSNLFLLVFDIFLLVFGLILAVAIFLFWKYKDVSKKPHTQSQLLLKYKDLLRPIIAEKRIRFKESSLKQLIINYRDAQSRTTFALYESENKLFVTWANKSLSFGNRGKEWCFQQNDSQEAMYLQIRKDIDNYMKFVRN
jgi:hypothetical protein